MNVYTPDRWAIIKITYDDDTLIKVFGGWYCDITLRNSWRLSSRNIDTTEFSTHYEIYQESGNVYRCTRGNCGMSSYMSSVFAGFAIQFGAKAAIEIVGIESCL